MIRKFVILGLSLCLSLNVFAQGDFISIGVGPSLLYGENAGDYRTFTFKIQPSFMLSYNKQMSDYVGLKASVGAQIFDSGGFDPLNTGRVVNWGNQDQAFDFKGIGYFADFVPIFTTNPNTAGMLTSALQFYFGLGLGAMYIQRDEKILKNGLIMEGNLVRGDIVNTTDSDIIPYIPIRTGISTNLEGNWDYALEFVLMTMTNSQLDGNNIQTKVVKPDMKGQIQISVKRYIGPAW